MFFCWIFLVCLFIHYGSTVMPVNQHDKISPKSQLNSLYSINYINIHLKSKTEMRKVQESSGKLQKERKTITEINRVYSQEMSVGRAKNYPNIANKEKETKQKAGYNGDFLTKVTGYNLLGPKVIKEKSFKSGIASQKENKLLKLRNKREAEYFLSVTKREANNKTNKSSTLALEETTLKSEKTTQMISNSAFKYNVTTVQNTLLTNEHSN